MITYGWFFMNISAKVALTTEGDFLERQKIEDVLVKSHLVLLAVVGDIEQVHDVSGRLAGVRTHILVLLHLMRRALPRASDAFELAWHASTTTPTRHAVRRTCTHGDQHTCRVGGGGERSEESVDLPYLLHR